MKKFFSSIALLIAVNAASGCFLANRPDSDPAPSQANQSEIATQDTQVAPPSNMHGIEITWEVPAEPVDGFIIRYGNSPSSLSKEVTIQKSDVREEPDPDYGPVYRYLIRDVDGTKKLFVSIAAVKGQTVSNFSHALEVHAE